MQYSKYTVAIALAGFIAASSAQALPLPAPLPPLGPGTVTYFTGSTSNAPTYNRLCVGTSACGDGTINPSFGFQAALSGVGTAVRYLATEFTVAQQGVYSFFSASTNWDNYTFLYRNSFTPSDPFANLVIGNDDLTGINVGGTGPFMNTNNHSGFTTTLEAATPYLFVNTAHNNVDFGDFVASITGPAGLSILSAVPEPDSAPMLALGLAGLAWVGRRRGRAAAGNPVGGPTQA
jgi:hypothetical protein